MAANNPRILSLEHSANTCSCSGPRVVFSSGSLYASMFSEVGDVIVSPLDSETEVKKKDKIHFNICTLPFLYPFTPSMSCCLPLNPTRRSKATNNWLHKDIIHLLDYWRVLRDRLTSDSRGQCVFTRHRGCLTYTGWVWRILRDKLPPSLLIPFYFWLLLLWFLMNRNKNKDYYKKSYTEVCLSDCC